MSSKKWKKTEKDAAKIFGTVRTPFSGSNSGITSSDSVHSNLYIECKTKEKHSVKTLFDETREKAKIEGKVPLIVLRENDSEEVLWVFEEKDMLEILKQIDLSVYNRRIPKGTILEHILASSLNTTGLSIYDLRLELEKDIDVLIAKKVLSKDEKSLLKSMNVLCFYIDNIVEYMEDK